jgi:hypothetical protein
MLMKKLDIMNMRKGEEWVLKDGKEVRVEKKIIVEDMPVKEVIVKKKLVVTEKKPIVDDVVKKVEVKKPEIKEKVVFNGK